MSDTVIVDTDVVIDAGRKSAEAVDSLDQVEQRASLAISVVTQMELMIGCRNKLELQALERFLSRFQIIPLLENTSTTAVDLLRRYRLSHGLLIADALIAATALEGQHALLTKNQRDFRFIEGLSLLTYHL